MTGTEPREGADLEVDLQRGSAQVSADRQVRMRQWGACARREPFPCARQRFRMSLAALQLRPGRRSRSLPSVPRGKADGRPGGTRSRTWWRAVRTLRQTVARLSRTLSSTGRTSQNLVLHAPSPLDPAALQHPRGPNTLVHNEDIPSCSAQTPGTTGRPRVVRQIAQGQHLWWASAT